MAQSLAEALKHTGPAEKERVTSVPQIEQMASTPESPLPNGPSVQMDAKTLQEDLESLDFTFKSGQTCNGKGC